MDVSSNEKVDEGNQQDAAGYIFDAELTDFVAGGDTAEYSALLYRFNETEGEGKRRVQIFKYYNEIPDSHLLGIQFGSGRYLLCVTGSDRKGNRVFRSFNLRLGKNYDDLAFQAKKAQNIAAIGQGQGQGQGQTIVPTNGAQLDVMQIMNFALTLVEKVTKLQAPMQQPAVLPEAVLTNLYQHMQRLMFSQARDTQKMINDLRQREEPIEGESEPVNNDFALKIIDLIKGILPTILNPVMAKAAVSVAKKTDEFKRIQKNPELREEVISGLKKEVGEKNTARIVEQFGMGGNQKKGKITPAKIKG